MVTLKERIKIALLVLGIFLGVLGAFLLSPFPRKGVVPTAPLKGMFAQAANSGALDGLTPWIIATAALALLGAYLLRER